MISAENELLNSFLFTRRWFEFSTIAATRARIFIKFDRIPFFCPFKILANSGIG